MHLRSIVLRQFRSHRSLELSVDSGVNLFLGLNGAGKTNLIEAIAVLTTGVSPRGADSESLVQWGENGFFVEGSFGFDEGERDPFKLEMKYRQGSQRQVRENGQTVVKLKDLLGKVPLVSFVPEDLSLVKGEPDLRRQAVNMILMQVDVEYAAALRKYSEVLRSRNAALRQLSEGQISDEALEPWDQALIDAGFILSAKRHEFLQDFSPRVALVHQRISGGKETIELVYQPSLTGPWDDAEKPRWLEKLKALRLRESAMGSSLLGPQRDEIVFNLSGKPARSFASEGQKRTAAVSFKLAEIPYVQERLGEKPICLLDDVLSELDAERAGHLLDELAKTGQCFVTLTGLENWPRHRRLPASIYRVDETGIWKDDSLHAVAASTFALAH